MEVQSSRLTTTNPLLSATSIVSSAGDSPSSPSSNSNHKAAVAGGRCADGAAELNGGCTNGDKTNGDKTNGGGGAGCFSLSPASSHSEIEKELHEIALNGSKSLNGSAGSLSFVGVDAVDDAQCKSQNGSLSGISDGSVTGAHPGKSSNGTENEGVSASGSSTEQTNGQASELMGGSTSSQSATAAAQLKKRISSSRTPTRKARRIKFYRNGDRFYPGITIPVSNERYRSFDSLFEDLTRMLEENVKIPGAVRTIYTMCGKKVGSLEDFEDGLSYVCSCNNEGFKKIEYNTTSQPLANLNASTKVNNRLSKVLRPSSPMKTSSNGERLLGGGTGSPITIQSSVVFPRIVTLIRNGTKPRKIMRLLLNKRNSPTYEHVLTAITQVVRLDTYVRKVFTLYGNPVTQLSDFFGSDDVFFAYGAERVNAPDDFKLEPEEQKAIQAIRKTLRTAGTTCKGPKPKMPVKKSENIKTMAPGTRKSAARVKATAAAAAAAAAAEETSTKPSTADSNSSPVSGEYEAYLAPEPASGEPTIDVTTSGSCVEEVCAVPLIDCDIDIDDMPPPIRERYSLGPVIGDGNFAVVLKIKDRQSGLPYALKIIDKSKCKGKEHYIDAEVRVMKKLQHPHIISLIMDVDQRENMFLVLEYVSGGDLFDAITRVTRFSENQSRVMIRHLASAMAYLHSMSIVHRDIKPENLMVELDDKGNVLELKLADFGLACEVTEPLTAVCGTPTYVAPEILMETGYDLKIDVWAAGIILYILLCGFPPFVSPDNEQEPLFDAIIKGVYEFPEPYWSDIGDGVRDLINNMLQSDPEVRFSSEDILDHYWTMEEERDYSDDYSS